MGLRAVHVGQVGLNGIFRKLCSHLVGVDGKGWRFMLSLKIVLEAFEYNAKASIAMDSLGFAGLLGMAFSGSKEDATRCFQF